MDTVGKYSLAAGHQLLADQPLALEELLYSVHANGARYSASKMFGTVLTCFYEQIQYKLLKCVSYFVSSRYLNTCMKV